MESRHFKMDEELEKYLEENYGTENFESISVEEIYKIPTKKVCRVTLPGFGFEFKDYVIPVIGKLLAEKISLGVYVPNEVLTLDYIIQKIYKSEGSIRRKAINMYLTLKETKGELVGCYKDHRDDEYCGLCYIYRFLQNAYGGYWELDKITIDEDKRTLLVNKPFVPEEREICPWFNTGKDSRGTTKRMKLQKLNRKK